MPRGPDMVTIPYTIAESSANRPQGVAVEEEAPAELGENPGAGEEGGAGIFWPGLFEAPRVAAAAEATSIALRTPRPAPRPRATAEAAG